MIALLAGLSALLVGQMFLWQSRQGVLIAALVTVTFVSLSNSPRALERYGEDAVEEAGWITLAIALSGAVLLVGWEVLARTAKKELDHWALQKSAWIQRHSRWEAYLLWRQIRRLDTAERETLDALVAEGAVHALTCEEVRQQITVAKAVLA